MVTYPINVSRDGYRGSDPKKRAKVNQINAVASKLEACINDMLKNQEEPIRVYSYHEIASKSGIDYETVRRLGFSIDAGSGGFTAVKVGLSYEQAMEMAQRGSQQGAAGA